QLVPTPASLTVLGVQHPQVVDVQIRDRKGPTSATLQWRLAAVKACRIELVVLARAKESCDRLSAPDPVYPIQIRLLPQLAQTHGVGRTAEQAPAPDHPLRALAELPLDALVG